MSKSDGKLLLLKTGFFGNSSFDMSSAMLCSAGNCGLFSSHFSSEKQELGYGDVQRHKKLPTTDVT